MTDGPINIVALTARWGYSRAMNAERAAREITRAYGTFTAQHGRGWMSLTEVSDRTDLTRDDLTAGIKLLARTDERFLIQPEADQRSLTAADRANAVRLGGEDKHLICWDGGRGGNC